MSIPRRRPFVWLAAIAALVAHGCFACEREVVTQPGVSVVVRDATGSIEGAKVTWFWSSDPHNRFEGSGSAITDGRGAAAFEKQVSTERVMPLCMHGVPFHNMSVCVESPGHRSVAFALVDLAAQTDATVTLEAGESTPCAFENSGSISYEPNDAVESTNVDNAWEIGPDPGRNEAGPEAVPSGP